MHDRRRCRRRPDNGRWRTGRPSRRGARPGALTAQSPFTSVIWRSRSQSIAGFSPLRRFAAGFHQGVRGERRVPHRRQAGLAIGACPSFEHQQLLDRPARRSRGRDGPPDSRARRTSSRVLAIAGKIAPRPSSPFRRSVTKCDRLVHAPLARPASGTGPATRGARGRRRGRSEAQAPLRFVVVPVRHLLRRRREQLAARRPARVARLRPLRASAPAAARSPCATSSRPCRGGTGTSAAAA